MAKRSRYNGGAGRAKTAKRRSVGSYASAYWTIYLKLRAGGIPHQAARKTAGKMVLTAIDTGDKIGQKLKVLASRRSRNGRKH